MSFKEFTRIVINQQNIQLSDEQDRSSISAIPQYNLKPKFVAQLNGLHNNLISPAKKSFPIRRTSTLLQKQQGQMRVRGTITKALDEGDYQWQSKADIKIRGKRDVNGLLDGPVQIIRNDGFYFKGYYKNGIRMNGFIKFQNGFTYQGQCSNDQFRGFGVLTFPNGKLVTGEWYNGYVEENARIDYPTGQIYYGSLKKLKKHGQGHLFFTDNSKYSGEFQEGLIHGRGQYYKNDQLIAKGTWNDGVLDDSTSGYFLKQGSQISIKLESQLSDSDITF